MKNLFWCLLLAPFFCAAQSNRFIPLHESGKTSLRGLSVVSDHVFWVSGSHGSIGKTIDGGKTWTWLKPKGYENLDFRDIEAFDELKAIVVNAGSPAYVLKTTDGGQSWTMHYKNVDSAIFLDGLGFFNQKSGIIFGDPIKDKMQLLKTEDMGNTWTDISRNLTIPLASGEAGFAASGSTIKTLPGGKVWVASGGAVSNIYHSEDYGQHWDRFACPIWQGESSTGPFSMDFYDAKNGIVVGGNYTKDKLNDNNVLLTNDGGRTWKKPSMPVYGYRSGVSYITKDIIVATGTSGTDVSVDAGRNWKHLSDKSFNAVQKIQGHKAAVLAGDGASVYYLSLK